MYTDLPKIAIVIGSTRSGRRAESVGRWVHQVVSSRPDASFEIVDLADHDLPLYDEPVPAMAGRYAHEHTRRWAATVAAYDGFIFVTPEYNHAPPAALKNAMDYLHAEWNDKAAGFVSYGVDGGLRAVEHLRLVAAELKIATVRAQVTLVIGDDWADRHDPASCEPRDLHLDGLGEMVTETVSWARALRSEREVPAGTDVRPDAASVAGAFVAELQAGLDAGDAEVFNASFSPTVLWGSPFGAVVDGYEALHAIHGEMLGRGRGGPSRYDVLYARAPTKDTVTAVVHRVALDPDAEAGFDEILLCVLTQHDGRWQLAAGQNTPIREPGNDRSPGGRGWGMQSAASS